MRRPAENLIDAVTTTGSAELLAHLTRPSASYKNSARLAVCGLLGFLLLYLGLASWFVYTAAQLVTSTRSDFFQWVGAACLLFLGVFMLKAMFFVRAGGDADLHELHAEDEPRLFNFLNALADAAGAPRPHRVFVSNDVNASVFYDLSLFNLIFPSKKNLVIGLPLVNLLSLGELRAVLAHEFGHFAQRSMAVGRWVYVAQQIAAHLVARRDSLEDMLDALGRIDIRVRILVLGVQLVIWAIRSLIDSGFRLVIIMQRALSREMELQADLVAVSLTGSDALIHALHRLQVADDAWARAQGFVFGERADKKLVRDAYAVQTHVAQRMARILDEQYAPVPPVPADRPEQHRVFKARLAAPPRMWRTHPLNHEREANAKRRYVRAPVEPTSAWGLFRDPARLRETMTAELLGPGAAGARPVELAASLEALGVMYRREQYHTRYHGVYFGRPLARHAAEHTMLRDPRRPSHADEARLLYPESLRADVSRMRALQADVDELRAIIAGTLKVEGATVRLHGRDVPRRQLPAALMQVEDEMARAAAGLQQHDHLCRSWHQAMADRLGAGWPACLDGLLALVHYSEHAEAEVRDAAGYLHNFVAVIVAGRVTSAQVADIVLTANQTRAVLEQVYLAAPQVVLDERVRARLELAGTWSDMLGKFEFALASRENINDWLGALNSWVNHVGGALSAVRAAALEQLLLAEAEVARMVADGGTVPAAPAPARVPARYPVLLSGAERKRATKLGMWARFRRADGWLAGAARLGAALFIVGSAIAFGLGVTGRDGAVATPAAAARAGAAPDRAAPDIAAPGIAVRTRGGVTAINGLQATVTITLDGIGQTVAPGASAWFDVDAQRAHHVRTATTGGALVEEFDQPPQRDGGAPVYNVAAATPLRIWTATHGQPEEPARPLGATRWQRVAVDVMFDDPPAPIRAGGVRQVLAADTEGGPASQLAGATSDEERRRMTWQHARFDDSDDPRTPEWIARAAADGASVLPLRLGLTPRDVPLRRLELDLATPAQRTAVCAQHAQLAARFPADGDMAYLALRCAGPQAFARRLPEALARWPANPWLLNAAAYEAARADRWDEAEPLLYKVVRGPRVLALAAALELARIRRFEGRPADASLPLRSPELALLEQWETTTRPGPEQAFRMLDAGQLEGAVTVARAVPGLAEKTVRMAAASDGASPALIRRALALPPAAGIDRPGAVAMWALARREHADAAPYRALLERMFHPEDLDRLTAFAAALDHGASQERAQGLLRSMAPEERGLALAAGLIMLGAQAPAPWRGQVRALLFVSERPGFNRG